MCILKYFVNLVSFRTKKNIQVQLYYPVVIFRNYQETLFQFGKTKNFLQRALFIFLRSVTDRFEHYVCFVDGVSRKRHRIS